MSETHNIGVGVGQAGPVLAGPDLMKFIIKIAHSLCAYYSQTTSKVFPMPLNKILKSYFLHIKHAAEGVYSFPMVQK